MIDKPRRDRVGLGLIGLGPCWEESYRQPITRLKKRLNVRLVYDPVEARSRAVAAEIDAEPVYSLRQILGRSSLKGLLILDPGWCRTGTLNLIIHSGRPAFIATPVLLPALALIRSSTGEFNPPRNSVDDSTIDELLIPELGQRLTPSSCRLRELLATKLGAARRIEIECDWNQPMSQVAAYVDWACDIMGQSPASTSTDCDLPNSRRSIQLEFAPSGNKVGSPQPETRTVRLRQSTGMGDSVRMEVECRNGRAALHSRTDIVWQTDAKPVEEHLHDERTETEILIDQFCRRALGGLNPIGRLSEFARAMQIVESAQCNGSR